MATLLVTIIFVIPLALFIQYYSILPQPLSFNPDSIQSIGAPSYFSSNIHADIVSINDLKHKWQLLFFHFFIKTELIPTLQTNELYSSSINNLLSRYNGFDATSYSMLLNKTIAYFSTIYIPSNHNHRDLLSMQRMIMLIHSKVSNIDNASSFNKAMDGIIKFQTLKSHMHQKRAFFNIHISKSAGTTLCDTAHLNAKYDAPKENCNIHGMGTPIKTPEYAAKSCKEIESMAQNFTFFAQESPMSGHHTSLKPTLCDNYFYILSVRRPITRIASTLTAWSTEHYWPFQILIKYRQNFDFYQDHLRDHQRCNASYFWMPNGDVFGPPVIGMDFQNFISHLFENEANDKSIETFKHNNFACHQQSTLGSQYRASDLTQIEWLGHTRKYGIKITEGFKDRVNADLIRAFSSNTLCRFIGYKHRDFESVYDALLDAKSFDVNVEHWLNAIDFMMMTDYVLPFDTAFEHQMWDIILNDLFDSRHKQKRRKFLQQQQRSKIFDRVRNRMNGKGDDAEQTNTKRDGFRWRQSTAKNPRLGGKIRTAEVLEAWNTNKDELEFINNLNMLDNELYKLSIWIANVDLAFRQRQANYKKI